MAPNKDIEIGDEAKTFEVIHEEEVSSGKDFESPHLVRRGLTEVSAMFDRHGKGYLDDTERALRRMDSQNAGSLGIDKVCMIFESLQAEQERSAELLEALRVENKKSLSLKRGVIALAVFAVILALANIGTSFAVSKLVKDTTVTNGDLVALNSGARLGTTSKLISIDMQPVDETTRRRLTAATINICRSFPVGGSHTGESDAYCRISGVVNYNKANSLYTALQEVDKVMLSCNNKRSTVFGGPFLPAGTPGLVQMGSTSYRVFPDGSDPNEKFLAVQSVRTNTTSSGYCNADFQLGIYCPPDSLAQCFVMTASLPSASCPETPVVCGPKPLPGSSLGATPLSASRSGMGGAANAVVTSNHHNGSS